MPAQRETGDRDERPLRVGVAGYGLSAEVFHCPLIEATSGMEIAVIVTSNEERSARAAARYPDAHVVSDVARSWELMDLLVIATPNRSHAELALAAAERDLPVVIDKPLAATLDEAQEVVDAGGRVTVFQNRRWDGDFLTLRAILDEGRLGDVVRFESRFERFRQEIRDAWRESGDPRDGGGQLADLGAHLIDQAIVLFGPPRTVYAEVDSRRPGAETDDDTFIALEHDWGIRSHLHMGLLTTMAGPRFRLAGLRGGVAIDGLDPQEAQLKAGHVPGSGGFGKREPGRILISGSEEREMPLLPGRYEDFYAGVASWLSGGGEAPVDPADSLRVMKVIETARASSKEREVMPFSE